MEQRGSRGGKKKADAATIPKIAGPGRKGSPEFVFGGRLVVEQDMLAAAGVVKVQNGGLSRSRPALAEIRRTAAMAATITTTARPAVERGVGLRRLSCC